MTLYDVIRRIEASAAIQPSVNMIVRQDVYRLNDISDAKYGVFAWLQGQHRGAIGQSFRTYTFTLFYVDRLAAVEPLDDTAAADMEAVQSVAVETIDNVIKTLAETMKVDAYTFRTFNQRFSDQCAGAYAEVELSAPIDDHCAEPHNFRQITII